MQRSRRWYTDAGGITHLRHDDGADQRPHGRRSSLRDRRCKTAGSAGLSWTGCSSWPAAVSLERRFLDWKAHGRADRHHRTTGNRPYCRSRRLAGWRRGATAGGYLASNFNATVESNQMAQDSCHRRSGCTRPSSGTVTGDYSRRRRRADLHCEERHGGPVPCERRGGRRAVQAEPAQASMRGLGIVVAGPIVAALAAAGSVGLAGGLISALTHWGIPKGASNTMRRAFGRADS